MRFNNLGDEEDYGYSQTVPIKLRHLEAKFCVSESLDKIKFNNVVTEEHATKAVRLFKVSKLDSENRGKIKSEEVIFVPTCGARCSVLRWCRNGG